MILFSPLVIKEKVMHKTWLRNENSEREREINLKLQESQEEGVVGCRN